MRIDFPVPAQYDQLMALWQEAFGDSEEFVDGFFCTGFSPARCRCMTDEGNIVAALYWFDARYQNQRFAYVYAVAVKKTHRGRGLCAALMEDTHAHLKLRGYDGVLLMPQTDSLREMYGAMGYADCARLDDFTQDACGEAVPLRRIGRDEYALLRRKFLPADGALQEEESIAYLEMMAFFYAGDDFLLAAYKNGKTLYCPELLGNRDVAPGILAALSCTEGHFRTPGTGRPGAMLRPLAKTVTGPGYLGLTFE